MPAHPLAQFVLLADKPHGGDHLKELLVGLYPVFSSLIIPALATRKPKPQWQLPAATGIGLAG